MCIIIQKIQKKKASVSEGFLMFNSRRFDKLNDLNFSAKVPEP